MSNVIQMKIAEREEHLRHARRAYLRATAAELGTPYADLARIALREAMAMVDLARELVDRGELDADC